MPKQLYPELTFDTLEDEVLFTRAGLQADPRAAALLARTDTWLSRIDALRSQDRTVREKAVNASAARSVNDVNLDAAVTAFGDSLLLAVGKDRTSPRWTGFFDEKVSRYVRRSLKAEVSNVLRWLRSSTDPVLEPFRPDLSRYAGAADAALAQTDDLRTLRAENWLRRRDLARELTTERDRLHDELSEIARQNNLPRNWPDAFFRVETREEEEEEPAPDAGG